MQLGNHYHVELVDSINCPIIKEYFKIDLTICYYKKFLEMLTVNSIVKLN